jgi:hypothetical protein
MVLTGVLHVRVRHHPAARTAMSNEKKIQRESKKAPTKTMKEKRAAKAAKRAR